MRIVAEGLRFPEGPVAMPDGSVLVVELARRTLSRVSPGGAVEVVTEFKGSPNGAAVGPDGAVYITDNGGCFFPFIEIADFTLPQPTPPPEWSGGCVHRVDLATGKAEVLYTECDGRPLRAPNDLVFDSSGGFWFTDHGVRLDRTSDRTGVFYARPDGSSITEVVFPLDAPNGVGLSPDEDQLYVAETHTGRVFRFPLAGPGQLGETNLVAPHGGFLLAGLPGMQLFDSLAVEADGHVCVATLINGGITTITPDGATVEHVPLPDPLVTNLCFGGDDLRTAFVTMSATGQLAAVDWPRPGLGLPFGTGVPSPGT